MALILTQDQMIFNMGSISANLSGAATVRLFTNNFTPTPQTVLADYTQATFTGYAGILITSWENVAWASQGVAFQVPALTVIFQTASPYTVGETVYGFFIELAGTPPKILGGERFANPVSMVAAGNQIVLGIQFGMADPRLTTVLY